MTPAFEDVQVSPHFRLGEPSRDRGHAVLQQGIGNVTVFSRHGYGDAADIFIDEDHDGPMDDLDHDGKLTLADAHALGDIVNATENAPEFAGLTGGMGMYAPTETHGAFVHIDVRGFDARWGA